MNTPKAVQIIVYRKPNGRSPFKDWITRLKDGPGRASVAARLRRMEKGNFGDHKPVGKVFELRVQMGPGYRVYFGKDGEALVILLAGGDKRTQYADIKKAEEYWNDFKTCKAEALHTLGGNQGSGSQRF